MIFCESITAASGDTIAHLIRVNPSYMADLTRLYLFENMITATEKPFSVATLDLEAGMTNIFYSTIEMSDN